MRYRQHGSGLRELHDNLRINWPNVSYARVTKTNNNVTIKFFWKYKAAIYSRELSQFIPPETTEKKVFADRGLYFLMDDLFINTSKILFTEEKQIPNTEDIDIHMVFDDGQELNFKININMWSTWRGKHLS